MRREVKCFVQECDVCQRNKGETIASPGFLQPLLIPSLIWSCIFMDFVEGLPLSLGKEVLFVVNCLTKYGHFCALSHPYTAATVAQVFVEHIFKLHGMPQSIVCDCHPIFTSAFWKELFRLQGT